MKTLFMIFGLVAMLALFFVHENTKLSMPSQDEFESWSMRYNKFYKSHEVKEYRRLVYFLNKEYIANENQRQNEYRLGENGLMDLTTEEFKSMYLTYIPKNAHHDVEIIDEATNDSVDWTAKGMVSPVKDQGQCGSCWAFSTTGNIESEYRIKKSQQPLLSEQQLVDCSKGFKYGNLGCNGGNVDRAFKYVMDYPITTEDSYPYIAKDEDCKTKDGKYGITGYGDISLGNCTNLKKQLQIQPVSVAVDAQKWSYYKSGVFSNCGMQLDHAVLATGYTDDYWIVKNSWGTSWGLEGYIHLKPGNTCGICLEASYSKL